MRKQEKVQEIIIAVAAEFSVDPMDIVTQDGRNSLAVIAARQVSALILKDIMPAGAVGSLLGKRGHQYVDGAVKAVTKKAKIDHEFFRRALKLTDRFSAKWLCSP